MGFTGAHVLYTFDAFILALYLLFLGCALLKYTCKPIFWGRSGMKKENISCWNKKSRRPKTVKGEESTPTKKLFFCTRTCSFLLLWKRKKSNWKFDSSPTAATLEKLVCLDRGSWGKPCWSGVLLVFGFFCIHICLASRAFFLDFVFVKQMQMLGWKQQANFFRSSATTYSYFALWYFADNSNSALLTNSNCGYQTLALENGQ